MWLSLLPTCLPCLIACVARATIIIVGTSSALCVGDSLAHRHPDQRTGCSLWLLWSEPAVSILESVHID
jgi:hypothetical protein